MLYFKSIKTNQGPPCYTLTFCYSIEFTFDTSIISQELQLILGFRKIRIKDETGKDNRI